MTLENSGITQQFGHAHAASGLLHVAACALSLKDSGLEEKSVCVDALGDREFWVSLLGFSVKDLIEGTALNDNHKI